ncbi:MAG TPA: Ig-like domain-containing protein [Gemmatimonadales bacterium]|nr:Ig-like domain-containing protein [Gemmatimonadales bacterium]
MRAILSYTSLLAVGGLVLACQSGSDAVSAPPDPADPLTLAPSVVTITGGANARLQAIIRTSDGERFSPTDVTWHSSNQAVATVADGLVLGRQAGRARIVATWRGSEGTSEVVVLEPKASKPKPEGPCVEFLTRGGARHHPTGEPCI